MTIKYSVCLTDEKERATEYVLDGVADKGIAFAFARAYLERHPDARLRIHVRSDELMTLLEFQEKCFT